MNPSQAIQATIAKETARIIWSSRLGDPIPEADDVRGMGLVDFAGDRVWITDRLATDRIRSKRDNQTGVLGRQINRVVYGILDRLTGRGHEIYFHGGAEWIPKRDGSHGATSDTIDMPKTTRHPLCIFGPLAMVDGSGIGLGLREVVQGACTTRCRVLVWTDADLCVRRLSFQPVYAQDGEAIWSIVEFSDFGVLIDRGAPDV